MYAKVVKNTLPHGKRKIDFTYQSAHRSVSACATNQTCLKLCFILEGDDETAGAIVGDNKTRLPAAQASLLAWLTQTLVLL